MTEYPKDVTENLRYRAKILQSAENDADLQNVIIEKCRRNVLYFINVFGWTYDPRTAQKHLPFVTYDYQDLFILWDKQCAIDQEDNGVDKSRDMGATWCLEYNDLHDWLFSPVALTTLWGSRKEDYVDTSGEMDSIFEKFRYALRRLPKWMLPKKFEFNKHSNSMMIVNPDTGSSLSGESTNDDFSRGGRKYRVRFDEFAFWSCDEAAWRASADTTKCRTALSTPCGASNKFARLMKGSGRDIIKNKMTLHWTFHPVKSKGSYYIDGDKQIPVDQKDAHKLFLNGIKIRSTWYDNECSRRSESDLAQEVDIDYLQSGSPFFQMKSLVLQKEWQPYVRKNKDAQIPHGNYITGVVKDVSNRTVFCEEPDGWVRLFELPKPGGDYSFGIDTSEGLPKNDCSGAVLIDKYTLNTVATINGAFSPDDFALKCNMVEKLFLNCDMAPENNNHGYTTSLELHRLGSNLYYTKDGNGEPKRGFSTTIRTRPLMLDAMEQDIRKNNCELRDPDLIAQCRTFVKNKKGKPEADGDFLDDLVMARAIAGIVTIERPYRFQDRAGDDSQRAALVDERQRKLRGRYGR